MHPHPLPLGKLRAARRRRIIHKVIHRIIPRQTRAGVALGIATPRGSRLSGRVIDAVAGALTAALEGVMQPKPVADFMRGGSGFALAAGEGDVPDEAAVVVEAGGGRGGDGGGVGAETVQQIARAGVLHEGHEVDVDGLVVALAERLLHVGHLGLVAAGGPFGVDGAGDALEAERDAAGGVVLVEVLELFLKGFVLRLSLGWDDQKKR